MKFGFLGRIVSVKGSVQRACEEDPGREGPVVPGLSD